MRSLFDGHVLEVEHDLPWPLAHAPDVVLPLPEAGLEELVGAGFLVAGDHRHETRALHGPGHLHVQVIEDRRWNVDEGDRRLDDPAGGDARSGEDQGNADELLVDRRRVIAVPVLEELVPVVGQEDDERVLCQPELVQVREELAELVVGMGDLAVVLGDHVPQVLVAQRPVLLGADLADGEVSLVAALEHLLELLVGGNVRPVRVVEVHEQEEGHVLVVRGEPLEELVDVALEVLPVPVLREALSKSELPGDEPASREGLGLVARVAQQLGDRVLLGREEMHLLAAMVPEGAELGRVEAREQGSVHRRRPGRGAHGVGEPGSIPRQRVDLGACPAKIAIGAQVIRAQGVHADEDDVALSGPRVLTLDIDEAGAGRQHDQERKEDAGMRDPATSGGWTRAALHSGLLHASRPPRPRAHRTIP